jgi:hypothetical protein
VQPGDRVETLPGVLYWTDEPVRGHIAGILGSGVHFDIVFDEPQHLTGEFPATYTRWGLRRLHFTLLETDFDESTED